MVAAKSIAASSYISTYTALDSAVTPNSNLVVLDKRLNGC